MKNGKWLEAQYSVLGSMLLWPELVPKVLLDTNPSDFSGSCRTVYDAIRKLDANSSPVDPVTVNAALDGKYGDFLVELMEIVPSSAQIDHYIALVREKARVTSIRGLAQQLALAETTEEMERLAAQINGVLVDKPSLQIMSAKDGLADFYRSQSEDPKYLTWPIKKLNGRVYAKPGSFVIIGGTPSTGKSAWALQCAIYFSQKYKVGFFSLETDNETLRDRQYSAIPELSMDQIQQRRVTDQGWAAVARETTQILSQDVDLISAAGFTVADIRAVTTMKRYQIIFVDYLQLIHGTGNNRAEEVAGISMALHTMAQSLGVTVIALSQLKRKDGKESPSMSDLRESGQIEQDADVIMILQLENENMPDGPRGLYIAKNKQGRRFKTLLAFDGQHQIFTEARVNGDPMTKPTAPSRNSIRRPYGLEPPDPPDQFSLIDTEDPECPFDEKGQ